MNSAYCVTFSPNGKTLAAATVRGVKLWDVKSGKSVETPMGPEATVWAVAFSPDGLMAASAGSRRVIGERGRMSDDPTLRLWGLVNGAGDAGKEDLKRLQGKWSVVERIVDGKKAVIESTWTISENEISYGPDIGVWAVFKLDTTTKPTNIDINPVSKVDPKNAGKTIKGIYEIDGDTFKICGPIKAGAKERPTAFESKEGSGVTLIVLKRVKDMK